MDSSSQGSTVEKSKKRSTSSSTLASSKKTKKDHTSTESASPEDLKESLLEAYESCESPSSREKFRHEALKKLSESNQLPHLETPGNFLLKYKDAAPYFVFLSSIDDSPETWKQKNSITFPEILDKSLGEIEESLHITDELDMSWLCLQYLLTGQQTDSTILFNKRTDDISLPNTIRAYNYKQKSKITILKYKNGARIVMPSGNLCADDWYNKTQTVWISPHLPYLPRSKEDESKTGFKQDFINYLMEFDPEWSAKINLGKWLGLCSSLDFSMINVFFIGSVPGQYETNYSKWGLHSLAKLLIEHVKFCDDDDDDENDWPIIVQSSVVTDFSFGNDYWLNHELIYELSFHKQRAWRDHEDYDSQNNPDFKLVYPTVMSFDPKVCKSKCISKKNDEYRRWQRDGWKDIETRAYQWEFKSQGRDRALPGSNFYTRISPDMREISWVVLSSSNLSNSSWGYKVIEEYKHKRNPFYQELRRQCTNKYEPLLHEYQEFHIEEFAAGIGFFPKILTGQKTFPIQNVDKNGTPPFPLTFDLPLKAYGPDDKPLSFKDLN